MKVIVLTPDLAGNCVGRAMVLAEFFRCVGDVEIVGHQFGNRVWPPLGSERYTVRRLAGGSIWQLYGLAATNLASLRGDLFVVSKRLAVSLFYARALHKRGDNVVLDFDDDEIGLFRSQRPAVRLLKPWFDIWRPNSYFWTRVAESREWPDVPVLVASSGLQARYGGHLLYHLRNSAMLNCAVPDGSLAEKLSILKATDSVVFLGTPRRHKGLDVLARAVGRLARSRKVTLGVFGADDPEGLADELGGRIPRESLVCHGNVPMGCAGAVLSSAKVVVVPQQSGEGADLQTPAKVFDALCMGAPLVTTDVGDIRRIVEGAAIVISDPSDDLAMSEAIRRLLDDNELRADLGGRAAERFATIYSMEATRRRVLPALGLSCNATIAFR